MPDRTLLGYIAAASAISIYAGMFTVGRAGAAAGLDGYDQTALRFLVSVVLILPFGIVGLRAIVAQIGIWRCVAIALLSGAPYSVIFLGGLTFAPVAYGAALVPGLQPFAVMLLGLFVLGTRSPRPIVLGNLVCLSGLAVVFADQGSAWRTDDMIGIGLFLCAAGMWGGYAFFVRLWSVPARTALVIIGSLSPVLFLPFYFWFRGLDLFYADTSAIALQLLYQGGLVGIIAAFFYPFAISVLGSAQVAALSPAIPLLATLLGALFLRELPSTLQWISVALVTVGLAISQGGTFLAARRTARRL